MSTKAIGVGPEPPGGRLRLVRETGHDLLEYVRQLGKLLAAEMREKSRVLRGYVLLGVLASAFGAVGFLLLSLSLTAAIAYGIGSIGWALLIVGGGWVLLAAAFAWPLANAAENLRFPRTVQRVRDDIEWLRQRWAEESAREARQDQVEDAAEGETKMPRRHAA